MTAALYGVGLCHLTTAWALRPAARTGRAVLAAGGTATVLVAALPLPVTGGSTGHAVAAGTSFVALSLWPAAAVVAASRSAALRRPASYAATAVLLGLVGWFALELGAGSGRVGLSERVVAGAQALWPMAVVVATWRTADRRPTLSAA